MCARVRVRVCGRACDCVLRMEAAVLFCLRLTHPTKPKIIGQKTENWTITNTKFC